MSAVDERIVKMKFDNAEFKKNAADTKQVLSDVDRAVTSAGKGKGLMDLGSQMEGVSKKAGAMQVATVTAIATIVNKAVNAGLQLAKSFTLDPIKQGFQEYELKLGSIQTILANTARYGTKLPEVTRNLNELNKYADKTIYNFGEMTKNIGLFTNSGMRVGDATSIIKGFSNAAAASGTSAQGAASAAYQLSQAFSTGTIRLMDWRSLTNVGLGNKNMQDSLVQIAGVMGQLNDTTTSASAIQQDFNGSLQTGWLSADVMSNYLKIMAGDMSVAEQKALGLSDAQVKAFAKSQQTAEDAATKVRTASQLIGTLKEAVGSGWAQIFEVLFGDFNEATSLFTKINNVLGGGIQAFFNWLTKVIKKWDEFGGRMALFHTLRNVLAPFGAILGRLGDLWDLAFPGKRTGSALASLTQLIQRLTRPLNILAKVISGEITPMQGFFRILGVGTRILKQVGGGFGDFVVNLLKMFDIPIPSGDSGILGFFKKIGEAVEDLLRQFRKAIDAGDSIQEAFSKLKFDMPSLPSIPSLSLPSFGASGGGGLGGVTGKFGIAGLAIKDLTANIGGLQGVSSRLNLGNITGQTDKVTSSMAGASSESETLGDKVGPSLGRAKDAVVDFIKNINFDDVMASFNLAVLSTFVISMSRMFNTMSKSFEAFVGFGEGVNGILESASAGLKSLQTQARAKLLLNIAIAVGILAAALWVLSTIPAKKLASALTALAGIAVILKVSMGALSDMIEKMDSKGTNLKMLTLGATLVLFAISVSILASAMKKLNDVDFGSVAKAAAAVYILVKAMDSLSQMNSEGILRSAGALVIVSGALIVFAFAVKQFAKLDFKEFAEGIAYAAASLLVLTKTLNGFTSSLAGAAAMVVAVGALYLLSKVIKVYAALDLATFAFGLLKAGAALAVIAVIMNGFTSSLAGAAALVVAVGALALLAKVIETFASLDWGTFFKGLGMLSIAFVTLGALMALMGVFSPLILLGAAALLIFGGAMFLLGTGISFLAKGMTALIAISGGVVAAISAFAVGAAIGFGVFLQTLALQAPIMKDSVLKILKALIDTIVGAVPMIIDGAKRLWDAVMKELGGGGEGGKGGGAKQAAMQATGKSWISKLADGVKAMIPQLVTKAVELGVKFLGALAKHAGEFGAKGALFVENLINGIASRIGGIVDAATNLVVKFAEGLGKNIGKIVQAGIKLIGDFLHALAAGIRGASGVIGPGITDVLDAMRDVGVDMIKGLIGGLDSMVGDALNAMGNLAQSMIDKAKGMFKIFSPSRVFADIGMFVAQGLTKGIQDHAAAAVTAVASMVGGQIAIATEYISKFIQNLDQQAIAAGAKAAGLAKAAELAQRRADEATKKAQKTKKNKEDDKKAKALQKQADRAQKVADKAARAEERANAKVEAARAKRERAEQFNDSTLIEKAQMRSEDAQNFLDDAKAAELNAASKRAQAQALREAARKANKKDAKEMREQADALEKSAADQAKRANDFIQKAKLAARDALNYQQQAGAEAARLFQEEYDAERRADEEEAAFEKMTDAEKERTRRQQAAALQAKADADLAAAKELAYTDLDAANELAQQAMDEAERARQFLADANDLANQIAQGTGTSAQDTGGTVVNLDPTEAASIAFGDYSALYAAGVAAAAGGNTVQFNQYNTSPEALNPTDVYRHTNNQLAFAQDKLTPAA
jgi:tape measure domain-containing protein